MTNLLQRIYDFANEQVTADVNNSQVTTDKIDIASSGVTLHRVLDQMLDSLFATTTSTSYTRVGNYGALFPPPDEYSKGSFTAELEYATQINIGDSSATASSRLQYNNDSDGVTPLSNTEVTSGSTTMATKTATIDPTNGITTSTENVAFIAQLKTSNGSYQAKVQHSVARMGMSP